MAGFSPPGTFETVQQRRERNAQAFDEGIAREAAEREEERRRKREAEVAKFDAFWAEEMNRQLTQKALREEEVRKLDVGVAAQEQARQGVQAQRQVEVQADVAKFDAAIQPALTGVQAGIGDAIAPEQQQRQQASQWMRDNIDQMNAAILAPGQFESEQFNALPPMVQQILTERRQGGVSPGQAALNLGGTALKLLEAPHDIVLKPLAEKVIAGKVPIPQLGGTALHTRGEPITIPEETAEEILARGMELAIPGLGVTKLKSVVPAVRGVTKVLPFLKVPGREVAEEVVPQALGRVASAAGDAPKTLYHGSLDATPRISTTDVPGVYLTPDRTIAQSYGDNLAGPGKGVVTSYEVPASSKFVVYESPEYQAIMKGRPAHSPDGIKSLQENGYDGIRFPGRKAETEMERAFAAELATDEYVFFDPLRLEQIRQSTPSSTGARVGREVAGLADEAGVKQVVKPSIRIPDAGPDAPLWQVAARNIEETLPTAKQRVTLTETARTPVRAQRSTSYVEEYNRLVKAGVDPVEADKRASGLLAGKLPAPAPLKVDLPEEQRMALFLRAGEVNAEGQIGNFELKRVVKALAKLDEGTEPLQMNEINLIRRVFGDGMADTLQKAGDTKLGVGDYLYDIAVLPKAVLSAFDVSYPFRQGIMLGPAHPKEFFGNMPEMFRVWASEARAQRLQATMLDDAFKVPIREANGNTALANFGELFEDAGLYRSLDPALESAEEVYRGRLSQNLGRWFGLPGKELSHAIRASSRSFTTYGNKLRHDVAKDIVTRWIKADVEVTADRIQTLSNMLNRFSGRGTMGNAALTKALQVLFWSPQYRISGPQAWASILQVGRKGDPLVRREAAKNLVAYVTTGLSLLSLAELSGQFGVQIDPRATDFGKMVIGNQRYSFWGSMQTLVRTVARVLTGRRYDETLGLVPTSGSDQGVRWMRSGLAPEWAAVWDVIKGETFIGEPLRLDFETAKREAFNRLVPLAIQDIIDAVREEGVIAAGVTAPIALLGGGVQTYEPGIRRQLLETPKYVGLTPREIYDIQRIWEASAKERDRIERELHVSPGISGVDYAVGKEMGLSDEVIRYAGLLRKTSVRTKFPWEGGALNPAWVDIVIQNQDDLKDAGLENILGANYIQDAIDASEGREPLRR